MYSVLKEGGPGYIANGEGTYKEFVCDTIADIADLPTGADGGGIDRPRPGSTAVVTAAAMVYVLSNERAWVVLVEG